jgi:uncharacterized membrane protein YadS
VTRRQWLPARAEVPGLALACGLGVAAVALSRALPSSPFLSDILIAIVLGVVLLNTPLRRVIGLELPGPDREPDRYAPGLRWVGKWALRLSIILMGLKVRTEFFHGAELALIAGVIAVALPSTFFVAHAVGARLAVRRPMADVLAGGTMICGASAVNALAPAVGAHREEQGIATAATFLFSVVALLAFRPIAQAIGLDSQHAGLWSGLAVNDLSSAIAVGTQMGGDGGVMAAAAKSARVLMLAPTLMALAFMRRRPVVGRSMSATAWDTVPRYLFGYVALAVLRAAGDRLWPGDAWTAVIDGDTWLVSFLLLAVAGAIGVHLELRRVIGTSARAVLVGGTASVWMAALTLAMIVLAAHGNYAAAALVGLGGVAASFVAYRRAAAGEAGLRVLERRFASGLPVSLAEATQLLDVHEQRGDAIDDALGRRVLKQLYPSIGELIPARESPLAHGDGSRWTTYWESPSGWALVAIVRDPGSSTPIHAHSHRLFSKTIEGVVEELRFRESSPTELVLEDRTVMAHDELIEQQGLSSLHAVRNPGARLAIDLQLRGPESGEPGRRLRTAIDLATLVAGARIAVHAEVDDRPGHGGEGAGCGRWSPSPAGTGTGGAGGGIGTG